MQYKVLARKYRPKNFAELVGQDVLVATLSNAIEYKRVHHAYLLTGIRGVGKTTTARIIAKNLNCLSAPSGTISPCDTCANCLGITSGSHPDVIEFDAASNTGIDDVKIIIDACKYAPVQGRVKVFIVDEVHMLSKSAFNALLKTLEEPPETMVFIFATTEIRKVPVTVLSRCQKFVLRSLSTDEIKSYIDKISNIEGCSIANDAATLIASKSGGSVRDALSMLDQAILNAQDGHNITFENLQKTIGVTDMTEIKKLFDFAASGNKTEALSCVAKLVRSGVNEYNILCDLIDLIAEIIKSNTSQYPVPFLMASWNVFMSGIEFLQISHNKLGVLEILLVKVAYSAGLPSPVEIIERLKNGDINAVLSAFPNAKIIETA